MKRNPQNKIESVFIVACPHYPLFSQCTSLTTQRYIAHARLLVVQYEELDNNIKINLQQVHQTQDMLIQ